jgi:hypothetical protein
VCAVAAALLGVHEQQPTTTKCVCMLQVAVFVINNQKTKKKTATYLSCFAACYCL